MAISTIGSAGLTAGAVDSTQLATAVQPLGVGQTWQDVKASRAYATTYTNTTGRPIEIMVTSQSSSSLIGGIVLVIGGVSVMQEGANAGTAGAQSSNATAIIPSGVTYSVTNFNAGTIQYWFELR